MFRLPWGKNAWTILVASLALQPSLVAAIAVSICSSENTGSDSTPNNYNLQSLGHCSQEICIGFAFAIAQGKNCWCSNIAPAFSTSTESCNNPCPGFPYEFCGSTSGDYSYVQLRQPSGTAGSFDTTASDSSPTTVYAPSPTTRTATVVSTIVNTIISSNIIVSTSVKTTDVVLTSIVTETPLRQSSYDFNTFPTPSSVISVEIITVSGGGIQTVTVTPVPDSGSTTTVKGKSSGLSGGAIAGIVIGVLAGVALFGLLLFCCLRRRRGGEGGVDNNLNRGNSVLSKAGLLRNSTSLRTGPPVVGAVGGASAISRKPPRLDTDIPETSEAPSSAGTGLERRDSRPLFVDHRLNPNVLMVHSDYSRTSVGTLQDNQDYSRPLEVRNP